MAEPSAPDNLPAIPFTSVAERDAAEASGQYAANVAWVRLDNGTIVQAGYVDLTGAFIATGAGGLQEVATFAALLALPAPIEGDEARVTNQAQFGDYTYSATLGGDAVGEWMPTWVYRRLSDWARKGTTLEATKVQSANGGGTNDAADFKLSASPQKGWASTVPDLDVTDVGGDIQFVSSVGAKGISMSPIDGAPIAYGVPFFMILEVSQTVVAGVPAGLNGRFRVDTGQGVFGYLTYQWDTGAPLNNVGWIDTAGNRAGQGAVHAGAFEKIFVLFDHIDPATVLAADGITSVSKIWAPGIATPDVGGVVGVGSLAAARITELTAVGGASDISMFVSNVVGNTLLLRKWYVFQLT